MVKLIHIVAASEQLENLNLIIMPRRARVQVLDRGNLHAVHLSSCRNCCAPTMTARSLNSVIASICQGHDLASFFIPLLSLDQVHFKLQGNYRRVSGVGHGAVFHRITLLFRARVNN